MNAAKVLSLTVAPILRTTFGAGTGCASRIDGDKPNTVLLRQTLDTLSHTPICPRSGGFPKTFSSAFLLAALQANQIFDADCLQAIPAQLLDDAIDEVITLDTSAPLGLGAGASTAHPITKVAEVVAKNLALAGGEQLGNADIDAEYVTVFAQRPFGNFDPDDEGVLTDRAALDDPCAGNRQPFVENRSALGRNGDALAFAQRRQTHDEIESAASEFDIHSMAEDGCAFEHRPACGNVSDRRGFLGATDNRQGLLERLILVEGLQTSVLFGKSVQRFAIKLAAIAPQRADVKVDGTAIGFEQARDFVPLLCGGKIQSDLAGPAEHGSTHSGNHSTGSHFVQFSVSFSWMCVAARCCGGSNCASAGVRYRVGTRPSGAKRAGCGLAFPRSRLL
ncbi:MAG TPA: hypothetical protein VEQ86_10170 [Xanthobacteraceae bacterium]|nr:hypothetical protein [Xanthobacteraceae bacterium]